MGKRDANIQCKFQGQFSRSNKVRQHNSQGVLAPQSKLIRNRDFNKIFKYTAPNLQFYLISNPLSPAVKHASCTFLLKNQENATNGPRTESDLSSIFYCRKAREYLRPRSCYRECNVDQILPTHIFNTGVSL
jgi:hypothetical protein